VGKKIVRVLQLEFACAHQTFLFSPSFLCRGVQSIWTSQAHLLGLQKFYARIMSSSVATMTVLEVDIWCLIFGLAPGSLHISPISLRSDPGTHNIVCECFISELKV